MKVTLYFPGDFFIFAKVNTVTCLTSGIAFDFEKWMVEDHIPLLIK